jgi:hypothetical protein
MRSPCASEIGALGKFRARAAVRVKAVRAFLIGHPEEHPNLPLAVLLPLCFRVLRDWVDRSMLRYLFAAGANPLSLVWRTTG